MVLMLPMWWNLSPEVWFSVLPLPANHVCGLRYWGWLMWQFCLAEYHIESGRWDVRDWGPKFSWSSHKPCLSLDDMRLISHCYFHNSCRSQLKFSSHIQPVYNNLWLDHEFETKPNLCRFAKDLTSMINIMPSHCNFNSQGFWNDGCWCFQKWWSRIEKTVHFWVLFFVEEVSGTTFQETIEQSRKHAVFACMINRTYVNLMISFQPWLNEYIYNIYLYCTWVSEWLSFTHRQVSFGATFTEQSSSSSNWFSPKGGRHVGEAHLPPSCCEADLRWWSLAGGLQCYDASASDGAIGTWRRLGWTNDVFHLGVSCCTMIPSHSIWYTYIYISVWW